MKPGYKQTEAGIIPKEWDAEKFGDFISLQRGHDLTWRDRRRGEVPVMGSAGQNGFHDTAIAKGPGVVLGRSGASFGQANYCEQDFWPHNTALYVTDFRGNDPLFVFYFLKATDFSRHNSGGAQQSLNRNFIAPIPIGVPRPPEQRAIAEALSDVDALLAALDRLIVKKRDLKQAAMQQLLTGQTRLPGFHGEWALLNMADNSTLKARIGWQGLTTDEYLESGPYYLVTGTDFLDGHIGWSSCHFVAAERYNQDRNIQLRPKDILLTKDGTIGKVAFIDHLPGPGTLNSGVFVIRPRDGAYDPKFFFYVLTSRIFDEFLIKLQAGSTISHLYQKDFVSFSFLAPVTIGEQTAIAELLGGVDAELAGLEQRREKTNALRLGMTQELLSGRTRLVSPKESHA
jgi:type I restriction enzyme, S subunit